MMDGVLHVGQERLPLFFQTRERVEVQGGAGVAWLEVEVISKFVVQGAALHSDGTFGAGYAPGRFVDGGSVGHDHGAGAAIVEFNERSERVGGGDGGVAVRGDGGDELDVAASHDAQARHEVHAAVEDEAALERRVAAPIAAEVLVGPGHGHVDGDGDGHHGAQRLHHGGRGVERRLEAVILRHGPYRPRGRRQGIVQSHGLQAHFDGACHGLLLQDMLPGAERPRHHGGLRQDGQRYGAAVHERRRQDEIQAIVAPLRLHVGRELPHLRQHLLRLALGP